MVATCHVTWIIVFVITGPPKRLEGSVRSDSFRTTSSSPPAPWMAAARTASDPATISGTFTGRPSRSRRRLARRSARGGLGTTSSLPPGIDVDHLHRLGRDGLPPRERLDAGVDGGGERTQGLE